MYATPLVEGKPCTNSDDQFCRDSQDPEIANKMYVRTNSAPRVKRKRSVLGISAFRSVIFLTYCSVVKERGILVS